MMGPRELRGRSAQEDVAKEPENVSEGHIQAAEVVEVASDAATADEEQGPQRPKKAGKQRAANRPKLNPHRQQRLARSSWW